MLASHAYTLPGTVTLRELGRWPLNSDLVEYASTTLRGQLVLASNDDVYPEGDAWLLPPPTVCRASAALRQPPHACDTVQPPHACDTMQPPHACDTMQPPPHAFDTMQALMLSRWAKRVETCDGCAVRECDALERTPANSVCSAANVGSFDAWLHNSRFKMAPTLSDDSAPNALLASLKACSSPPRPHTASWQRGRLR